MGFFQLPRGLAHQLSLGCLCKEIQGFPLPPPHILTSPPLPLPWEPSGAPCG